jgi:hypothetical protein
VRAKDESGEVPTEPDIGEAQPDARVSFTAEDFHDDAARLDGAAGCEYVDDAIRMSESQAEKP